MKYIGVDYGTRRVGIAVSDESGAIAFPRAVVEESRALEELLRLSSEEGATTIVLGESRDFSGAPNPVMKQIEAFKTELESKGLAVVYEAEALTSAQAARNPSGERAPIASPSSQAKRDPIDAAAAALILQAYLDRNNRS